jgi:hypothetical protein
MGSRSLRREVASSAGTSDNSTTAYRTTHVHARAAPAGRRRARIVDVAPTGSMADRSRRGSATAIVAQATPPAVSAGLVSDRTAERLCERVGIIGRKPATAGRRRLPGLARRARPGLGARRQRIRDTYKLAAFPQHLGGRAQSGHLRSPLASRPLAQAEVPLASILRVDRLPRRYAPSWRPQLSPALGGKLREHWQARADPAVRVARSQIDARA